MPTAAILPIKRFDRAKQRLDTDLGADARATLAVAMLSDVLAALEQARTLETVFVVSGEPSLGRIAERERVVLIRDLAEAGQSRAAREGLKRAAGLGYERALLIPGDCPLLDPREIDALMQTARSTDLDAAIVPDRHQKGTNALLLRSSCPLEPQFGPGSLARHVEQATRRELRYSVEPVSSLALDIDTNEDLGELEAALERRPGHAPFTRQVLREIGRPLRPPVPA